MRGTTTRQATMLSTLTSDSLIPLDHPIRRIKPVVEAVLAELGPEFDAMYARTGRQSVPPEHLVRHQVLMRAARVVRLCSSMKSGSRCQVRVRRERSPPANATARNRVPLGARSLPTP